MTNGEMHKFLLYSAMRRCRYGVAELRHTVIAADVVGLDETFGHDAKSCNGPVSEGLWMADFQYTEEDDGVRLHWKATQVSDWVRLTAAQADALAQGKTFAEVVAA